MRIYLTPMIDESKSPTKNPYINDLINTLEQNGHTIINKNKFSKIGLFNILFYLRKSDAIYFNWIEDLIGTRFGLIQTIYVYLSCIIFKIMGKKIIWTLHNKISHSKNFLFIKIINTYFLLNYSDLIITHTKSGLEFSNLFLKNNSKNVKFIHHPIYNNLKSQENGNQKKYDLLIWGAISPYKGIDKFLNYLLENKLLDKYRICILGKIKNHTLESEIMKFKSEKIDIFNEFVNDNKLNEFIKDSKIILFTYTPTNTFASGSLMYSLSFRSKIIGPNVGSFKDLKEENLISTFDHYNDMIETIDLNLNHNITYKKNLEEFININSWLNFGRFISESMKKEKK